MYKFILFFVKLLLLIGFILNTSCSTVTFKNYEKKDINSYSNLISKNGLSIAVENIENQEDCIDYFGIDLIKNNILPVYIVAYNGSKSSNFLFLKEKIKMFSGIDFNTDSSPGKRQLDSSQNSGNAIGGTGAMIGTFSVIMPVAALAAAPVLLLAGGKQIADTTNIKHNFIKNEIYNKTIPPNASNDGFIYLKIPDGFDINQIHNYTLSIDINNSDDNKIVNFNFKM